jgi:hypothetical protein
MKTIGKRCFISLAFLTVFPLCGPGLFALQLYLAPNTVGRFGPEGEHITAIRTDPRGGADRHAPLVVGTKDNGILGIFPFDSSAVWKPLGFSGKEVPSINLQGWGAGPVDGFLLQAAVSFGVDSTREYSLIAPILPGSFPLDTTWVSIDNDSVKRTLRRVYSLASGNYSGHEPPAPVLAGGRYGVVRLVSSDSAATHEISLDSVEITAVAHDQLGFGGLLLAGGSQGDRTAIYLSDDEGASWSPANLPSPESAVRINAIGTAFARQKDTAYAGTTTGLWRSTDDGRSWLESGITGTSIMALAVDPLHPHRVFVALDGFSGFVWSADGGTTWKCVDVPLMGAVTSLALLYPASPDSLPYLFIGTAAWGVWAYRVPEETVRPLQNPVYYPLATGNTWFYDGWYPQWKAIGDTVLQDGKHYSILQENHYFTTRLERQQGDSVYWGGTLLYDFTKGAGDVLSIGNRGVSYIGAVGDTVLFDRKLRWWSFVYTGFGMLGGGVSEIVVDSLGMAYHGEGGDIGWNESLLKGAIIDGRKYGLVDAVNEGGGSSLLPGETCLLGNYPNPFNPNTRIQYTVGRSSRSASGADRRGLGLGAGNVKLVVYDLLGRELAVLVNEPKAPGTYEVRFDASGLASGVYVYRLTAGSFVQARTMLLLK